MDSPALAPREPWGDGGRAPRALAAAAAIDHPQTSSPSTSSPGTSTAPVMPRLKTAAAPPAGRRDSALCRPGHLEQNRLLADFHTAATPGSVLPLHHSLPAAIWITPPITLPPLQPSFCHQHANVPTNGTSRKD